MSESHSYSAPAQTGATGGIMQDGFGAFQRWRDGWYQHRSTTDGLIFIVSGKGSHPSESQVAFWNEIDSRLTEIVQAAKSTVNAPEITTEDRTVFEPEDLKLTKVELQDSTILIGLNSEFCDRIQMGPDVVMTRSGVTVSVDWLP